MREITANDLVLKDSFLAVISSLFLHSQTRIYILGLLWRLRERMVKRSLIYKTTDNEIDLRPFHL